jgi:hypothetical protein
VGQTKIVTTVSDMNSGRFCEFLSPGKYHVQVVVDIADSKKRVTIFPESAEHRSGVGTIRDDNFLAVESYDPREGPVFDQERLCRVESHFET